VPVWVDEIPPAAKVEEKEGGPKAKEKEAEQVETLQTWTTSYLSPTASEVLGVLGSIILTFRSTSELPLLLGSLQRIVNKMGMMWDGVCLAVAMGDGPAAEGIEDTCLGYGFELVEFNAGRRGGRNEYGEVTGMDRVVEALAAGDWAGDGVEDEGEGDEDGGEGKEKEWLGGIWGEMEREIMGLKVELAREGENEEKGVENLEAVLARLQMVKGAWVVFCVVGELADVRRHGRGAANGRAAEDGCKGRRRYHDINDLKQTANRKSKYTVVDSPKRQPIYLVLLHLHLQAIPQFSNLPRQHGAIILDSDLDGHVERPLLPK